METAADFLVRLGLSERNPGVCLGPEWLIAEEHFASIDPANGEADRVGQVVRVASNTTS